MTPGPSRQSAPPWPAGPWWRVLFAIGLLLWLPQLQAASPAIPRPPELERDVQFWVRVYSQVTTQQGLLHDEDNLAVVYGTVYLDPEAAPAQRRELIDVQREHWRDVLRRMAAGEPDDDDAARVRALFGDEASPARFARAAEVVRFQLGQADRFREGLRRSGIWGPHITDVLATKGLPAEVGALPHVESSFDPAAYSKVGAAGLWQFMRSTGRRFLRIDDAVDERLDPFRSTEAAAQLLDFNYRLLGSWPLALTAYNHGAAGMRRARDAMGTDDIVRIVRGYKSTTFGFASRNFYVSFLAALEIDRNPQRYFGQFERLPEQRFRELELPAYVPVAALERVLKVDRARLQALNPALRPPVWSGQRVVPKGYQLRLPAEGQPWTAAQLAARLAPTELLAGQPKAGKAKLATLTPAPTPSVAPEPAVPTGAVARAPVAIDGSDPNDYAVATDNSVRVAAAETLARHANWLDVPVAQLAQANGLKPGAPLQLGARLQLLFTRTDRAGYEQHRRDYHRQVQADYFARWRIAGTEAYVTRAGDSLWSLTQRFARLPVWLLQQYNPDTDFSALRPGLRLVVPRVEERSAG